MPARKAARTRLCHTFAMSGEPIIVDAKGLNCPMPLLKAKQALNGMASGQRLRVYATDPGSVRDFDVFSAQSGHNLLASGASAGTYTYLLEKK